MAMSETRLFCGSPTRRALHDIIERAADGDTNVRLMHGAVREAMCGAKVDFHSLAGTPGHGCRALRDELQRPRRARAPTMSVLAWPDEIHRTLEPAR